MLAEKFILLMETLKSHASPDGVPRRVSVSARPGQIAGRQPDHCTLIPDRTTPQAAVAGRLDVALDDGLRFRQPAVLRL